MIRGRQLAAAGAMLALGLGGLAAGSVASAGSSAATAPAAAGTPGYCPSGADGVTVVVDFKKLGGGIVVRCAPGPVKRGFTGLDALEDAGFTPTGTQRDGLAYVCRINDRPSATQQLHVKGDPHYREACVNTPPTSAYWAYWYARNDGTWTYSEKGAANHDAIRGGFEGWSFSLNRAGDPPKPGVAPRRPHQSPPTTSPPTTRHPTTRPPTTGPTTRPTTTAPSSPHRSTRGTTPPTAPVTTSKSEPTHTGPAQSVTSPPSTAGATTSGAAAGQPGDNPVAVGHNHNGEHVTGALPSDSGGGGSSGRAALAGVLLVLVLGMGAGFAAWRRRRSP